jgi:hypothetical protein
MDFGIGYRWRSHESNLLLSVKLAGGPADGLETMSSAEPPPPRHAPAVRKPRPPAPIPQPNFFWFWR